jgi:hypothetical protein
MPTTLTTSTTSITSITTTTSTMTSTIRAPHSSWAFRSVKYRKKRRKNANYQKTKIVEFFFSVLIVFSPLLPLLGCLLIMNLCSLSSGSILKLHYFHLKKRNLCKVNRKFLHYFFSSKRICFLALEMGVRLVKVFPRQYFFITSDSATTSSVRTLYFQCFPLFTFLLSFVLQPILGPKSEVPLSKRPLFFIKTKNKKSDLTFICSLACSYRLIFY